MFVHLPPRLRIGTLAAIGLLTFLAVTALSIRFTMLRRTVSLAEYLPADEVLAFLRVREYGEFQKTAERLLTLARLPAIPSAALPAGENYELAIVRLPRRDPSPKGTPLGFRAGQAGTPLSGELGWLAYSDVRGQMPSVRLKTLLLSQTASQFALTPVGSQRSLLTHSTLYRGMTTHARGTLLASPQLFNPGQDDPPLDVIIASLLATHVSVLMQWDERGGTITLLKHTATPPPRPMIIPPVTAATNGALLTLHSAQPSEQWKLLLQSIAALDRNLADGLTGILLSYWQNIGGEGTYFHTDLALFLTEAASLAVVRTGSGTQIVLRGSIAEGQETRATDAFRDLARTLSRTIVRQREFLSENERTDVIDGTELVAFTESEGESWHITQSLPPTSDVPPLTLGVRGGEFILASSRQLLTAALTGALPSQAVTRTTGGGSVDVPWLSTTLDAHLPFLKESRLLTLLPLPPAAHTLAWELRENTQERVMRWQVE